MERQQISWQLFLPWTFSVLFQGRLNMNMHCHLDSMICHCSGPDYTPLHSLYSYFLDKTSILALFEKKGKGGWWESWCNLFQVSFVSKGGEIALYGQNPQSSNWHFSSRASLTVRILRYEIEKGLRAVHTFPQCFCKTPFHLIFSNSCRGCGNYGF